MVLDQHPLARALGRLEASPVLALSAEQAYLDAVYPQRVWRTLEFSPLFADGLVEYTQLPIAKEWPSLLAARQGHTNADPEGDRHYRGGPTLADAGRRTLATTRRLRGSSIARMARTRGRTTRRSVSRQRVSLVRLRFRRFSWRRSTYQLRGTNKDSRKTQPSRHHTHSGAGYGTAGLPILGRSLTERGRRPQARCARAFALRHDRVSNV